MSSPPAVPAAIDPKRHGQYALKVGKGLKSGSSTTSFSSVKFNHKPNLSSGTRTTRLSQSNDNEASLSITDQEDGKPTKYAYKGRRRTTKGTYVLIFDSNTQTCTLEPAKTSYTFNITSTPWEASSEKLARQYPQLKPDDNAAADDGELDEDPDGEADPENPYDFRHYLNTTSKGRSPSASPAMRATSTVNTPNLSSTKPTAAAARSRPANKTDPLRQAPRKQKAAPAVGKASQKPTPTVRIDRRASTRPGDAAEKKKLPKSITKPAVKSEVYVHSSDEDDDAEIADDGFTDDKGGLEIDWGREAPAPKKAMARVFERPETSLEGPISLHSAANSPMGRIVVPPRQQRKKQYEQDVIDFGTSDNYDEEDEEEGQTLSRKPTKDQDVQMRDIDEESEGDDDVEPMALGSPAHQKPDVNDEDDADFDAEFEAEMMQAMASADEDDEPATREESESESEAE